MNIVLVGNQNSGKSSLFNKITNSTQKVGNWAGVTVDYKCKSLNNNQDIKIIDLPGIYSLVPLSKEENLTVNYLKNKSYDLIVNVVEASSLKRGLFLTLELLELKKPMIICFTKLDLVKKKEIDFKKISEKLNLSYFLIDYKKIVSINLLENYFNNFKVEKKDINTYLNETLDAKNSMSVVDYENLVSKKYKLIDDVLKNNLKEKDKVSLTNKLDKLFLNKYLGFVFFALIIFLIYFISIELIGSFFKDKTAYFLNEITNLTKFILEKIKVSNWLINLICLGILPGLGIVISFCFELIGLFMCLNFLEMSGYLSRVAYLFDHLFRKFGLNGKSIIPFLVASSCSVPGILCSKTIEDKEERKKTIILTPFIPCSAKLPIISLFIGHFFPNNQTLFSVLIYFLAIIIILIGALILNIKSMFINKKEDLSSFFMELPEYRGVDYKYLLKDSLHKIFDFFKKTGSVILLGTLLVWMMLSFSTKFKYIDPKFYKIDIISIEEIAKKNKIKNYVGASARLKDNYLEISYLENEKWSSWIKVLDMKEFSRLLKKDITMLKISVHNDSIYYSSSDNLENSILAFIGNKISFIFYPIIKENNWAISVSILEGVLAKEQIVSSMAIISGFDNIDSLKGKYIFNENSKFSSLNKLTGMGILIFILFSSPCISAISALKKELDDKKTLLLALLFQTGLAWILAYLFVLFGGFFYKLN